MQSYKKRDTFICLYMEDIHDFESFYTRRLQPFLADLNTQSTVADKWKTSGIIGVVLGIVCFLMQQYVLGIIFIIAIIICLYKYGIKEDALLKTTREPSLPK